MRLLCRHITSPDTAMFEQVCGATKPTRDENDILAKKLAKDGVGPSLLYEDGYKWPDLYTELDAMIESNLVIYPLAALRKKAKKNQLRDRKNTARLFKFPLTHKDVMKISTNEKEQLLDVEGEEKTFFRDLFGTAEDRAKRPKEKEDTESREKSNRRGYEMIIAFDDEYAREELVYMIEVNHQRRRVTVCFRGSVTKTDWATNVEIYMKEVTNPLRAHASQDAKVRIHHGFYKYLFGKSSRGVKGPEGENISEYEEIMQEHIMPILHKYPGYKVCLRQTRSDCEQPNFLLSHPLLVSTALRHWS